MTKKEIVKKLEDQIDVLEGKIDENQEQIEDLEDEISDLLELNGGFQEEIDELERKIELVENDEQIDFEPIDYGFNPNQLSLF